jgi:hypothetical protein
MHTATIILANLALQKLICPAQEQLQSSLDLLSTSFQVKGFFFVFVDHPHPPEHMCYLQMQQEKQNRKASPGGDSWNHSKHLADLFF